MRQSKITLPPYTPNHCILIEILIKSYIQICDVQQNYLEQDIHSLEFSALNSPSPKATPHGVNPE
jgi:hypothetical protein